jgi:Na+-translocating ferredoxin:NAD+ oxidoreductase RnfC subunit
VTNYVLLVAPCENILLNNLIGNRISQVRQETFAKSEPRNIDQHVYMKVHRVNICHNCNVSNYENFNIRNIDVVEHNRERALQCEPG